MSGRTMTTEAAVRLRKVDRERREEEEALEGMETVS